MTTQTDPRERPEIRTTDDLLTAVRVGLEIATRSDIYESEHRVIERVDERFDAQDRRMDARFDAQNTRFDARFDTQDARFDAQDARIDVRFDTQDARFDARFDTQDARFDARFDTQDARFDAQNARFDARFDAQDRRLDAQGARLDSVEARLNENTAAIREFKTLLEAERRGKDRAIQWLSIGLATLGTLAAILGVAIAVTS